MIPDLIALLALAVWLYLLAGRGFFWCLREGAVPPLKQENLSVAVVIPARDEAANIGAAVASLLAQNYPGSLHVIVVDDHSADGTAQAAGAGDRLTVLAADPLPAGWTGKLWAVARGLRRALTLNPDYLLFTDADIVHGPDTIAGLVARAEAGGLTSSSRLAFSAAHSTVRSGSVRTMRMSPSSPRWRARAASA